MDYSAVLYTEFDESFVDDENVMDTLIQKQETERIVNAILQLPDTYKDVMFLSCVQEMSIKEIAALLNIKSETVKKRIQRGKKLLIDQLGGANDE